jgi:hypothetical protein
MPFKSKAQRRKFAQLLVEGKISDETYEEWNRSTGGKELPERLAAAKAGKAAKKKKSAPRKRAAASATKARRSPKRATRKGASKKKRAAAK